MFTKIVRVERTGSTNTDLMAALTAAGGADRAPHEWPHLSVLVADEQTAGRGRAGRDWVSAPGAALTCSVVIDAPALPPVWVPLLVGVAVRRAVSRWVDTELKWPNDVVLATCEPSAGANPEWRWAPKLAGILCELHESGAIVAGIGVNCQQTAAQLPVPWATSIATATDTVGPAPAEALDALGVALADVLIDWLISPGKVRDEYVSASAVIGERVQVTGAGTELTGIVRGIRYDGALLVETAAGTEALLAGDLHLR